MKFTEARLAALFSLCLIVPLGFATKLYAGPGAVWARGSLGAVFYEIFWCLFGLLIAPRVRPRKVAAIVFAVTCCLEFLQLWHPVFLELIRSTFVGRSLIGETFDWSDFAYYAVGSLIGCAWTAAITARWLKG